MKSSIKNVAMRYLYFINTVSDRFKKKCQLAQLPATF